MKHAIVVRDRDVIAPLEAPASASVLLGGTLFETMRARLEGCGLSVALVDTLEEAMARASRLPDGALVTHDSVAFSRSVVRGLLAAGARDRRPVLTAALPAALATRHLSHLGGLTPVAIDGADAFTAPLWLVRGGALADAAPVVLPYREVEWKLPTPAGMTGQSEEPFGATDAYLVRVDHWAQILRLNLAAVVGGWFERWNTAGGKLWYLQRAVRGFPWRRGRLAAAINRVSRGAGVHHSAHVELTTVEPGAQIGAHAVVKNSYVGRDARIDDGAVVNACVLGAGSFVATGACVFASVLYPGAFAAQQKMQFSVLGEHAVAFTGSYFYDLNLVRNVHVVRRGQVEDSGSRFLSVCLGPWARVAGGVWIGSGREVPAGALVIQPPGNVLQRIDADLAARGAVTVRDGATIDANVPPPAEVRDGDQSRIEVAAGAPLGTAVTARADGRAGATGSSKPG